MSVVESSTTPISRPIMQPERFQKTDVVGHPGRHMHFRIVAQGSVYKFVDYAALIFISLVIFRFGSHPLSKEIVVAMEEQKASFFL